MKPEDITQSHLKAATFAAYVTRHIYSRKDVDKLAGRAIIAYCKELMPADPIMRYEWVAYIKGLLDKHYCMALSRGGAQETVLMALAADTMWYEFSPLRLDDETFNDVRILALDKSLQLQEEAGPRPISIPKDKRFTRVIQVPVTEDMYDRLAKMARGQQQSLAHYVRGKL